MISNLSVLKQPKLFLAHDTCSLLVGLGYLLCVIHIMRPKLMA